MKTILPVFAAFALAGFVPAANAQSQTVKTSFADLDLTQAEDVAELTDRVRSDIRQACAFDSGTVFSSNSGYDRACVNEAMDRASEQIEAKRLAVLATVAAVD